MNQMAEIPGTNMQASAASEVASMAPHRNLARPRSEVRLSRALGNLSMSTEEKVLKMNYGLNYENHL